MLVYIKASTEFSFTGCLLVIDRLNVSKLRMTLRWRESASRYFHDITYRNASRSLNPELASQVVASATIATHKLAQNSTITTIISIIPLHHTTHTHTHGGSSVPGSSAISTAVCTDNIERQTNRVCSFLEDFAPLSRRDPSRSHVAPIKADSNGVHSGT